MRFGDRISCSTARLSRERWNKYWDYLDRLGLSRDDPLYRLFGGEVFHDGEISLDQVRLTDGVVVLQLRNVHAVNEVDQLLRSRKGKRTPTLDDADFRTRATFRGVKRLELRLKRVAEEFYYHSAELDRLGDDWQIKIYFVAGGEEPGWMKIWFQSVEVEDISRRLKRYLPPGVNPDDVISFVKAEEGTRREGETADKLSCPGGQETGATRPVPEPGVVKRGRVDNRKRFHEIMVAHGGKPGVPSTRFLAWLRASDLTERAVAVVGAHVLKRSAYVGPVDFYSEKGVLGVNAEDAIPIAIRDGLLIVGGCPNGDPVAIDVREQIGAAGYIDHETMWQVASVRAVFLPLAPSLGELAERLAAGRAPRDYYEALKSHQRHTKR